MVDVQFAYISDMDTVGDVDPRATFALDGNFSGLSATLAQNVEPISVPVLRVNRSRQFTVTRTFRVNHDLDAENAKFKLTAAVVGWSAGGGVDTFQSPAAYAIKDDETQTYTLSIPRGERGTIDENADAVTVVTLTADPARSAMETVPELAIVAEPNDSALYEVETTVTKTDLVSATAPGSRASDTAAGTIKALVDKNRVDDTVTLKLYAGGVGASSVVNELTLTAADIHKLPSGGAITAVAMDKEKGGKEVTEIMEGGDPVYLTITVDRGSSTARDEKTIEKLTVDLKAASGAQASDYDVTPTRVAFEDVAAATGKQTSEMQVKLTARSDEDVGAEDLVLNLEVAGESRYGTETETGTFTIAIVDNTVKKVWPLPEDEAYPAITGAMEAGGR